MPRNNTFFQVASSKNKKQQAVDMSNNPWEDEDSDLSPHSDELDVSSPEVLETDEQGAITIIDEEEDEETQESSGEWEDEEDEAENVSEEEQMSGKRKRNEEDEEDLDALRAELKAMKNSNGFDDLQDKDDDSEEQENDEDDDEGPEEVGPAKKKARTSKHAPTVQSSKHPVSRKRKVIPLARSQARDPRFDPVAPDTLNEARIRKNYGFLDDYVDSEIKNLKSRIKDQKPKKIRTKEGKVKTKQRAKGVPQLTEADIEAMKRELTKLESKRASQKAKDKELEVKKEHKIQERELVKQGKTPFFLKKSEVKKQVLIRKFEGMSEGKREKAMEKKRKRLAAKERRDMPWARRTA